jgi:transposase-like protein
MSQRKKGGGEQPHYPVELKRSALERLAGSESVASIASALSCPVRRLYYWQDQWRQYGEEWAELKHRHRRRRPPPAGSAEREAELERLMGQQQAELDF